MNLSIQDELQPFAEELQRYVSPVFLEELARNLGFVKRKRKFSGSDLATICIWMSQRIASDPLGLTISFREFCTFRHIIVTINPFCCTRRDICSENLN
ncbi:Transposase for insertion sequence element IS231A [Bacillus mycoides]|uniref:Transposase for insertion sequence element IS231A n=1 Tax=Bacillus mycoides TaxID=1405 RepID=A0A1G4EMV9_BACMY|nr:Transposase for insertion sequence element IS231A [Bacillus mycoides]